MIKVIRSLLFSWSPLRAALLVGVLCSVALISPVSAASTTQDPAVAVAIDATTPACVLTRGQVVGSSHAHKVLSQSTCAAGTFMKTQIVPLSQARAKHEAYVLIPTLQASATQQLQFTAQVKQMIDAKRQTVQPASPLVLHPNNDCGETLYGSAGENVDGNSLLVEVEWHISSSCSSIVLDTTEVDGYTSVNNLFLIADYYWGLLGYPCAFIGTRYNLFSINESGEPVGKNFEWEFGDGGCGSSFTPYDVFYGPLN